MPNKEEVLVKIVSNWKVEKNPVFASDIVNHTLKIAYYLVTKTREVRSFCGGTMIRKEGEIRRYKEEILALS
ncbi:MAG: hypothetical protein WC926_02785 [Candidatus Paceibacterota bacterium]|jgi:hypothetical protein